MRVQEILREKGHTVHTIGATATFEEVVAAMARHDIGSLIVTDPNASSRPRMIGLISERDLLRAFSNHANRPWGLTVADMMTTDPITTTPGAQLQQAMRLMTDHRTRHVPVMNDGNLVGVISIGDVLKIQHDVLQRENHFMKSYIRGEGSDVGTVTS